MAASTRRNGCALRTPRPSVQPGTSAHDLAAGWHAGQARRRASEPRRKLSQRGSLFAPSQPAILPILTVPASSSAAATGGVRKRTMAIHPSMVEVLPPAGATTGTRVASDSSPSNAIGEQSLFAQSQSESQAHTTTQPSSPTVAPKVTVFGAAAIGARGANAASDAATSAASTAAASAARVARRLSPRMTDGGASASSADEQSAATAHTMHTLSTACVLSLKHSCQCASCVIQVSRAAQDDQHGRARRLTRKGARRAATGGVVSHGRAQEWQAADAADDGFAACGCCSWRGGARHCPSCIGGASTWGAW
jgi:hypothetical protein